MNDDHSFNADVYIEDGVIKLIGNNLVIPGGARVIEARGKYLLPGGIDTSTHFNQLYSKVKPADDFYSGTKAALAGGTTMIFDYVVPEINQSILDAFNKQHEFASEKSCCDFNLHVCLTWWSEKVSQEMEVLVKDKGVNSFHICLDNDPDHVKWRDEEVYQILKRCKELKALLMVHAENGTFIEEKVNEVLEQGINGPEGHLLSRPEESEAEAVFHMISLASLANAPLYICKVMSQMSADVISESRRKGKIVFGEVMAPALHVTGAEYFNESWKHAASHVVSPPFRSDPFVPEHLVNLLSNDDLQVTSSDHNTYNVSQKALGKDDFSKIPSGVNGVQERMQVVWQKCVLSGKMDINRFVAVTSTNAAKIFNLYPRKGRIHIGSDADLIIWDPELSTTISSSTQQHKGDFNIFEGLQAKGGPFAVIMAGCVVLDDDGFRVTQGSGQYVSLPSNCDHVYTRILEREKAIKSQKIARAPYTGPVCESELNPTNDTEKPTTQAEKVDEFYNRSTRSGGRHQQDSSFHLSGAQIDESQPLKPSMKISQPPGGKSSKLW